ncbi:hypothetical protein ACIG0C_13910 [Kitasatospora aureofaciens]|uniref:Uncharacterized protein n=1 Tax=Kitasatospora aureofaciens TaxID=1894 RepID=A0A8H9HZE5_KITAU|nr:hypothetical protein [Kitasatospora aureofaciens]GGV02625.1 hypothetical protein GCM10010502_66580 [Kitasatospora aureofaciens]
MAPVKFFVGAVLLALLALAIATVALGVLATLKMPRPEHRDDRS